MVSCRTHPATPQAAQVQGIQNGVCLNIGNLHEKVQFYADDIVRVLKWRTGGTPKKKSLVVIETNVPDLSIHCQEDVETITLSSEDVTLHLSKSSGAIQFLTAAARNLLREQGAPVIMPVRIQYETNASNVEQDFTLTPDEGIYGLGQNQNGCMDYRGHTIKLVQANTDAVTPFLISTAGYGLLWDNYSKTIFSDNPQRMSLWSEVADNVDYYFIAGTNMDAVIAGYRNLTGQAPMYGKWAYGYWQSKEHYASQSELLGVAREYRERHIPIDNIVQDWDYYYEKGIYATIAFHWDDVRRQLTIGDRKGSFPGMLKERTFNIVLVGKGHGTGVGIASNPDKTISYLGKRQVIQF